MLRARVQSAAMLTAALVAAVFFASPVAALLIVMAVAGLGLREFYGLFEAARIPSYKIVGAACGLGLIAATWARYRWVEYFARTPDADAFALAIAALVLFVRQFGRKSNERPLETLAGSLMGVLYVGFLMTFFVRILMAWGGLEGRWLLLFTIAVVKCSDMGAYAVGCAIGRHKLLPRISPHKTWEGLAGGIVTAVGAALAGRAIAGGTLGPVALPVTDAVILGVLLSLAGTLGDLTESLLKRAAGVKDSGTMFAGIGGVLDVIDSLFFAAPLAYYYARFLLPAA
jgi:phosphatidate cytidylyltransferase